MIEENEISACAIEAMLTDDQQAEEVRNDSDKSYRIMADAMPQIVWTARPDGRRDYFNLRWYEHTRLSSLQAEGDGWAEALHEEDRTRVLEAWKRACRSQDTFEIEYRLLCADDGTYRRHIERATPLLAPNGTVVKWFGTCTDIDDLKESLARIDELNHRLRLTMVETHHRVKNNLQIISAMVDIQLLAGDELIAADEFRRLGSHIRTLAVVHDLLTEASKEQNRGQAIAINEVLEKLIPIHQATAPNHRITSHIEEARLQGRQGTSLALVINELISNAIKHGHNEVEAGLRAEQDRIVVTISDNGPGFPENFDPDEAAHTGLELVTNLARWDLRGEVVFASRPEGGGQVTITIPLSRTART